MPKIWIINIIIVREREIVSEKPYNFISFVFLSYKFHFKSLSLTCSFVEVDIGLYMKKIEKLYLRKVNDFIYILEQEAQECRPRPERVD